MSCALGLLKGHGCDARKYLPFSIHRARLLGWPTVRLRAAARQSEKVFQIREGDKEMGCEGSL